MEFLCKIDISIWLCITASLFYTVFRKRLSGIENFIIVVIWLNIIADLIAVKLGFEGFYNGYVYNILAPIERIITLMIYAYNTYSKRDKFLNYYGIGFILTLSLIGVFIYDDLRFFQSTIYVISGIGVAILSYVQLRAIALDKAGQSMLLSAFALANLVYYTLMVSSLSAYPIANGISDDFGETIYAGNLIAYSLWSIILIIGILWKRKT